MGKRDDGHRHPRERREYTISQLARAAGVPTTTVRYYERIGVVRPEDRSAGNYRLYSDESLRKLQFIRAAQAIGFTLDDIKKLLAAEDGNVPRCGDVQPLIKDRLADVEQKLHDLQEVQRVLQSALRKCNRSRPTDPCCVIESIRRS
ncbi:MAG: heavy metal-responsive transcriptional regulator [Planctomycetota bacterium]|nr:MAG: heavy metal-responsive transcriptional regulator [Planctomycetota bacterium]